MKGLIFTEFLNFVEQTMSYDMVDKILINTPLASGGTYTSIGTYDHQELLLLLETLSKESKLPKNILLIQYGEFLFEDFLKFYPQFFQTKTSTFHFLSSIENYIHIEVKRFYPESELPHFKCETLSPTKFVITYTSKRPLADLAEGLIKGCIRYHHENIQLNRQDFSIKEGAKAQFTLIKMDSLK